MIDATSGEWKKRKTPALPAANLANCFKRSFVQGVLPKLPIFFGRIKVEGKMGVSKNSGTPKWMVKIMENPIKKWMIWGENPPFKETSKCWVVILRDLNRPWKGAALSVGVISWMIPLDDESGEFPPYLKAFSGGTGSWELSSFHQRIWMGFANLAGRDFMGFFGFFNDSNWENVRISRVTLQCVREFFVMGIDVNPQIKEKGT